jgi:hypothetical protein
MGFSQRFGFCITEELKPKEYLKMRMINRKNLTKFLKRIVRNQQTAIEEPSDLIENYDSMSTDQDYDTLNSVSPSKFKNSISSSIASKLSYPYFLKHPAIIIENLVAEADLEMDYEERKSLIDD